MTIIELPDEEAALLTARAAAEGMALKDWLTSLAEKPSGVPGTLQSAADIVLEEMRQVPAEIMAAMPTDGASEHDHYLYGWRKKEA